MSDSQLDTSLVFKAMTRPAMILGVPLAPLFISGSLCFLFAIYTNIFNLIIFLPIYLALRVMTKIDENIFQLYGIKRFLLGKKLRAGQFKKYFKGSFYTHQKFQKEQLIKPKNTKRDITMLDLEKALSFEEIIPYSSHVANDTILTKDGSFISTWEVEGISYQTRDNDSLDRFKDNLALTIRQLDQENVAIYVHNLRVPSNISFHPKFNNDFAQHINESYLNGFGEDEFMENRLFLSLVFIPNKGVSKRLKSQSERQGDLSYNLETFKELSSRVHANINKFGVYQLATYDENDVAYSSQLEFYNFLLTSHYQKIRLLDAPIYSYLGNITATFGKDVGSIEMNGERTFVKGIEIKDWVQATHSGFLDQLIGLNCRYVITQSFGSLRKNESKTLIDRKIKQLRSTSDDAVSQQEALYIAKDALISGDISFGEHHFTLFIYADSLEEIKRVSNSVVAYLADLGFLTTFSNIALDEGYFSQLPGNLKFRPRVALISSDNFADMNSLHNNPLGKKDGNCWGNALSLLKTSDNSPFYFNFHQTNMGVNDFGNSHLAHAFAVGKSGTGKTVLANFLATQLMAYEDPSTFPVNVTNKKLLMIYLDKDRGAEANVKALGGLYNTLKKGESTGFNPFALENNSSNRDFLNQLVMTLITHDGSKLSTKDKSTIDFAVQGVLSEPLENRAYGITRLSERIQQDFEDDNSLRNRLEIWTHGNMYGWLFDNPHDSLSFDDYTVYGFDGTDILDSKEIMEPLSFYLLHRFKMVLDGRRMVIMLDEFWKWLTGDSFEEFVRDGLKTFRKHNAFLVMITQEPNDVLSSPIAKSIVSQVENKIFLPNPGAVWEDYKEFQASYKEFQLVQSLPEDSRMFLIKKGNESEGDSRGNTVLARLDLSSLSKTDLNILSPGNEARNILDDIWEDDEISKDPNKWIPILREKLN